MPSASPVWRKTVRTAFLLAVPAAKERGDRGRGTSAFEMVLSPGAGIASAAGVHPPAGHSGGRVRRVTSRASPRRVQRRQGQLATKSTHLNSKMHESTVPPPASGCKTPIFRKMAKIACIIHKYAVKYRIGVGKDSPHSHIHREPALRKAERKCLAECPGFP